MVNTVLGITRTAFGTKAVSSYLSDDGPSDHADGTGRWPVGLIH